MTRVVQTPMKSDYPDFMQQYALVRSSIEPGLPPEGCRICRFCGRSEAVAPFEQTTHLIPELLGRNDCITQDECDECNQMFSAFESHLSTFVRPHLTLLGVIGKRKVPNFQSRTINGDEASRTVLRCDTKGQRDFRIGLLDDYTLDEETKTGTLVFRQPPYVPLKIYKALLKIGLGLLPTSAIASNVYSFDFLIGKRQRVKFIPSLFLHALRHRYFASPIGYLYRAKSLANRSTEFPEYTLVLCFANLVLQIFLPFNDEFDAVHDSRRSLLLNIFPMSSFDNFDTGSTCQIRLYDLSIPTSVVHDEEIHFEFEGVTRSVQSVQV